MGNLAFASTANDLDNHLPKGRGECFDYGSWYGCDCDCPVFQRGECKCEDPEATMIMIEEDEYLDPEDRDRFYELYPQLIEYKNQFNK